MTRTLLLALVTTAACFGSGPEVSSPSEATIVYAVPLPPSNMSCGGNARFIDSMGIGTTLGFVALYPYNPPDCSNSGGMPGGTAQIWRFDKLGIEMPQMLEDLGNVQPPRVAASRTAPASGSQGQWLTNNNGSDLSIFTIADVSPMNLGLNIPSIAPAGLLFDGPTSFIAGWLTQNGKLEPNTPQFPGQQPVFELAPMLQGPPQYVLAIRQAGSTTQVASSIPFFCEAMKDCLVDNTTSLFFMARGSVPAIATIGAFPKTGTSNADATTLATIDESLAPDIGPVGLAADDAHVVWTASVDPTTSRSGCFVFSYTLATQTTAQLFATTAFSCTDAALDATSVYFAITSVDRQDGQQHGDGIGRVSLADGSLESISLGIVGAGSGPRRIYLDGEDMYAIDPLVIGKIRKTALDGQHAF